MALITKEIREFVNTQQLGFVATVCQDGRPNLSPKGTTSAWDDDHLVFADIHSPETVRNLSLNSAVEINVVDVFTRKGYRFKGTAKVLSEGTVFRDVIAFYGETAEKYKINHIVLVKVEQVLELTSPVYDTGESAASIRSRWIDYWSALHKKTL